MRKQKRKEKILHKPGCIDNSTCFCKYMPLEWKEEARKKVDKTEVSTTWVLCRDDIMPEVVIDSGFQNLRLKERKSH